MREDYLSIPGWFGFECYYDSIVARAPDGAVFVEIGCWMGLSTVYLASKIKESGKRITLVCVDTFKGSATEAYHRAVVAAHDGSIEKVFRDNLERFGVADMVDVHVGDSAEAANLFTDRAVDMAFIDADHTEDGVSRDILAWLPKIGSGGILSGHDYHGNFPGVPAAVNRLLPERFLLEGNVWAQFCL